MRVAGKVLAVEVQGSFLTFNLRLPLEKHTEVVRRFLLPDAF
jgi:hypothetical protein